MRVASGEGGARHSEPNFGAMTARRLDGDRKA
jgi:hypothetical protein